MKHSNMRKFPSLGNATVEKYSREANKNEQFFAATGGGDGFTDDANFMASGGAVSTQEPYRVVINNSGGTAQTAILFGQYKYANVANFGSGSNITITMGVPNATYAQMLNQSAQEPFEIVLTRIETSNLTQLGTSFLLRKNDSSGEDASRPITVSSYNSPDQYQANKTDVAQKYRIDGTISIEYLIQPTTTVTISFFVAAKINVARTLNNAAPVVDFNAQRVRTFGSN